MKTVSELTDFYYKKLYPILQELEKDRKIINSKLISRCGITTFIAILIAVIFHKNHFNTDSFVFLGVVYIIAIAIIYKTLIIDYTKKFKERIMRPLIYAIDKNLSYDPNSHVSSSHFRDAQLFQGKADRVLGNDLVRGKINGISIEFSDLTVQQVTDKNDNGDKNYKTLFQGLYIVSEFNKNFHGRTKVLPDAAQKIFGDYLGHILQDTTYTAEKLVKMDSVAFEKEFVVYSNDQIEARYILTPTMMEKILELKKRAKRPVSISFINKNIHIAIEYNKDLFEPSVFHSLLEYKIAMEYIQTLHLAIGITEELQLNQKLWSQL